MIRTPWVWGIGVSVALGLVAACGDDPADGVNEGEGGGDAQVAGATSAGRGGTTDTDNGGASGHVGQTPAAGEGGHAGANEVPGESGRGGADDLGGGGTTGVPPLLIDDLEDLDAASEELEGHAGIWGTDVDKHGSSISPLPTVLFTPGTKNCHAASVGCAIVSGTTVALDEQNLIYPFARLRLFFKSVSKVADAAFDASAYTGIRLWARGNAQVRFAIGTVATTRVADGGTCSVPADCGNDHSLTVDLASSWQKIELPFESLKQDPTWGAQVAFDQSKLINLDVWFPPDSDYAAAFDDVELY